MRSPGGSCVLASLRWGAELRVQVGRRDSMFPALGNVHSRNVRVRVGKEDPA